MIQYRYWVSFANPDPDLTHTLVDSVVLYVMLRYTGPNITRSSIASKGIFNSCRNMKGIPGWIVDFLHGLFPWGIHDTDTVPVQNILLLIHRNIGQNQRCDLSYFGVWVWNLNIMPWHSPYLYFLTHWGRVMHICVSKITIIGSDNDFSPGRHQAIIWTNAGILLIRPLGTNLSEILIGVQTFSFKKMELKMSSAKWRPFCLGLNEF